MKRQREDYERALVTITQLTSQTDEAAMQYQQVRQEADDALRRCAHLGRENEKMMKENADLSKQVLAINYSIRSKSNDDFLCVVSVCKSIERLLV